MITALYRKRVPLFLLCHAGSLMIMIWLFMLWLGMIAIKLAFHLHLYPALKCILSPITAVAITLMAFYMCTAPIAMWLSSKYKFPNSREVASQSILYAGILVLTLLGIFTHSTPFAGLVLLIACCMSVSSLRIYNKTRAAIREQAALLRTPDVIRLGCGTTHAISKATDSATEPAS